jgi:hypothetical protein
MRLRNMLAAAALGAGLVAGSAQAAIISGTFAVNASDFGSGFADFAGSFTLSFDNSADITDSTALTVNSLTVGGVPTAVFGTIVFSYDQSADRLNIGGFAGLASNRALTVATSDDFSLRFQPVSGVGDPAFFGLVVGTGSATENPNFQTGTFTPTGDRAPIPAPPALAVFSLGLLGLGLVRRHGAAPVH